MKNSPKSLPQDNLPSFSCINGEPQAEESQYWLGLEHLRQGIYESAAEYFRGILSSNPRDSQARLYLGIVYRQQQKITAALFSFLKVLKINPPCAAAWENLAELYAAQNLPEEAAEYYLGTAELYEKKNQWEKALKIYEKMAGLDLTPAFRRKLHRCKQKLLSVISPQEPSPTTYTETGFDHLLEDFKEDLAEVVETQDYDGRYELGIIYRETGLLDEAIAEFRIALSGLDLGKRSRCHDYLGLCLAEKGAYEGAIEQFQQGLKCASEQEVIKDLESHLVQIYEKWEEIKKKGSTDKSHTLDTLIY